jgi:hypothetical protein
LLFLFISLPFSPSVVSASLCAALVPRCHVPRILLACQCWTLLLRTKWWRVRRRFTRVPKVTWCRSVQSWPSRAWRLGFPAGSQNMSPQYGNTFGRGEDWDFCWEFGQAQVPWILLHEVIEIRL